jgi:hypothetical protein
VFEREKTVHALDGAATVIGCGGIWRIIKLKLGMLFTICE